MELNREVLRGSLEALGLRQHTSREGIGAEHGVHHAGDDVLKRQCVYNVIESQSVTPDTDASLLLVILVIQELAVSRLPAAVDGGSGIG